MKNQLVLENNLIRRIPNDPIYNVILTLILALGIVWIIYSITPYSHYSFYLIEPKKK